jgi:hypothetical protein
MKIALQARATISIVHLWLDPENSGLTMPARKTLRKLKSGTNLQIKSILCYIVREYKYRFNNTIKLCSKFKIQVDEKITGRAYFKLMR